jgi:hypothetical protein
MHLRLHRVRLPECISQGVTPAQAERKYATELADGSLRQIQREMKVGQGKAKALRVHLETQLAA